MQQTAGGRRGGWCAAFFIALGLGPVAVLPSFAVTEGDGSAWSGSWGRAEVQRMIVSEAVVNGTVPAALALAVADVESGFVSRTVGASGAIGLMQLLPAVVKDESSATAEGEESAAEMLRDPAANVRLGLRRLARLHQRYGGDWELALSHFRGGELPKEDGRNRAHDYTHAYVQRVMRCWRHYQRDRLVRAWIREARGEPRFVMNDAEPWSGSWASGTRLAPQHWIYTSRPAYDRHRAWYSHHRGEHRPAEGCDMQALRSRPPSHRFNDSGWWTALDGSPSPDFRSRGGRWVAVTGDTRFR